MTGLWWNYDIIDWNEYYNHRSCLKSLVGIGRVIIAKYREDCPRSERPRLSIAYPRPCLSYLRPTLIMMTSSNGNIFRVTGHLCGEFTGPRWIPAQRPVARSFDVFFDLRLNKRLSKQSYGWWFETLSHPLWCHRNVDGIFKCIPFNDSTAFWQSLCLQLNLRVF